MILASVLFAVGAAGGSATVTTVGTDLVLTRPVPGRVLAVFADVRIEAKVSGDVIVWGGDVSFGPGGAVAGNLSVFGGSLAANAASLPVSGTVSTPGTLLNLYLAEMRRPPWETRLPAAVLGLKLLGLAAWLAVAMILLNLFGSPFARAAARADEALPATALAGALTVTTLFLAAGAALALLPGGVAIPVALLVAIVAVAAKVFGMGSLFLLFGQKLLRDVAPRRRPAALAAGFAALAAISLVPLVGPVLWSAASIVAVGIALLSRFGRSRFRVRVS